MTAERELIERIKAALETEEDGDNLIEVARAANRAEHMLAFLKRQITDYH